MSLVRAYVPSLAAWSSTSRLPFAVLGNDRRLTREGEAPLAELPRADRVELILAPDDVLLAAAKLPRLSGARLRAALPNLLEEKVLTEVENLFVALGPALPGELRSLAAVQREPFERLLAACRRANLNVVAAYPASLTNAVSPGQWGVVLAPEAAWVRLDAGTALGLTPVDGEAAVPVELALAFARAKETGAAPSGIVVAGPADPAAWSAALGIPVTAGRHERFRFETPPLNLLQFELSPDVVDWKAWRLPAVLAGASLFVALVGLNVQWWEMNSEKQVLRTRMERSYRGAFPEAKIIEDPLLQMKQQIADLRVAGGSGSPDDFLPLANALGRALADASNPVRGLEYREGQLRVRFAPGLADSAAKRDALATRLKGNGLVVQWSEDVALVKRAAS